LDQVNYGYNREGEKGKPTAMWGRNATDLLEKIAGLPNESGGPDFFYGEWLPPTLT